jgi:hypothetical protein
MLINSRAPINKQCYSYLIIVLGITVSEILALRMSLKAFLERRHILEMNGEKTSCELLNWLL